jgi:hypothetical protein
MIRENRLNLIFHGFFGVGLERLLRVIRPSGIVVSSTFDVILGM